MLTREITNTVFLLMHAAECKSPTSHSQQSNGAVWSPQKVKTLIVAHCYIRFEHSVGGKGSSEGKSITSMTQISYWIQTIWRKTDWRLASGSKKQDGDGPNPNVRLQNGRTQTNGWRHGRYIHTDYDMFWWAGPWIVWILCCNPQIIPHDTVSQW